MRVQKRIVTRVALFIEAIVFLELYCFGSEGVKVLQLLHDENKQLAIEIDSLQKEVDLLDCTLIRYRDDPFFLEKVAREELQMARPNDEIVFVKEIV